MTVNLDEVEAFPLAIGKRPGMYYGVPNNCALYNLLFEMIGYTIKRSFKVNIFLHRDGSLNTGITIESNGPLLQYDSVERWNGALNVFNAMYCGKRMYSFNTIYMGGAIVLASTKFELKTNDQVWVVEQDEACEDDLSLTDDPRNRIVTYEQKHTPTSSITWFPDFRRFQHFNDEIIVDRRDDGWPACRFHDENFRISHSKRAHSGINMESIDRDIVAKIVDYCWKDSMICFFKPVITIS